MRLSRLRLSLYTTTATPASLLDRPERLRRTRWAMSVILGCIALGTSARAAEPVHELCVVVGAAGEADFEQGFEQAARAWERAAARGGITCTLIGLEPEAAEADREKVKRWLEQRANSSTTQTWLVYLGHGTFDGREARLNLRGPDVTAKELGAWLAPLKRPLVFVHGGSAGAPFIPALSAGGRILITATRSGNELNYARFGERFAEAVANPSADIDQDGQTSVLEAFVTAAQQVQAFYAEHGRLATEHALIDDNGDKQGTPAEWYRGTRLQRRPKGAAEPDGARANLIAILPSMSERSLTAEQRETRAQLEQELEAVRARKSVMSEPDYYRQLELIFRRLEKVYRGNPASEKTR